MAFNSCLLTESTRSGDFFAESMFIYHGPESTAVDTRAIYYVVARALLTLSANVHDDDASLQLYGDQLRKCAAAAYGQSIFLYLSFLRYR